MARATRHIFITDSNGSHYIISSLASRRDTQVITIDPVLGGLSYTASPGVDVFANEADAHRYVSACSDNHEPRLQVVSPAILGYVVLGNRAHLLLASSVSPTVRLPGGHVINTITKTQWINIELEYPSGVSETERQNMEHLMNFPVAEFHYYCETYDLTRTWPALSPVMRYDPEFCWNDWLCSRLERAGLRAWAVVLLQGQAVVSTVHLPMPIPDGDQPAPAEAAGAQELERAVSVCLISKKSSVHPGTRFIARGLNPAGGAGNECEVEQIVWVGHGSKSIKWCSTLWRRGTVPVKWDTHAPVVGDQHVVIDNSNAFLGVVEYYKRILRRYARSEAAADKDLMYSCINLLKIKDGSEETKLSQYFQESLPYAEQELPELAQLKLNLINFDFHGMNKMVGHVEAADHLWKMIQAKVIDHGLSSGDTLLIPTTSHL